MESPVVVDKPPEYHGRDDRGFPFDDEEGSGAWSELAARHPDIAARLRQRDPAAWARKRRSPQPAEFGDGISNFDRFPFNDIPPEFREHFPSPWNRRFGPREDGQPQEQFQHPQQPQPHPPQQPQPPRRQSTATQTEYPEQNIPHSSEAPTEQQQIPQHGLRNTVDLGQKSAADPRLVDGEDRSQRSMSAPPDSRPQPTMSAPHSQQEPAHGEQPHSQSQQKVRNIPIFVEGRDAPVINKNVDNASHFGDAKPAYTPPPPHVPPHHVPPHHVPPHHVPPHHVPLDDSYFVDDAPMYHPPRNFSQSFGTPYGNKFRPNPQPFAQQKVYPQGAAFARGASPGRAQSPKPHPNEEIKIPVQREKPAPQRPQPTPHQHPPHPQQHQPPPPPQQPQQQQPQQQPPPPQPPKQQPQPQDPITQILAIQTDVLNLMTDVEKFIGNKKDKQYLWLDEMLTRNLLKLDNIETDGKENIRNARKEAIRCIQKCIAVLEAKADGRSLNAQPQENQQPADVDMKAEGNAENGPPKSVENGEVEMKESKDQTNTVSAEQQPQADANIGAAAEQSKENPPQANDTRPGDKAPGSESKDAAENTKETEKKPKKGGKTKKRDKSKDNSTKTDGKDNKSGEKAGNVESSMQVDDNGNKEPQKMEVDGASQ